MRFLAGLLAVALVIEVARIIAVTIVALAVIGVVGLITLRLTDHYIDMSRARQAVDRTRTSGGIGGGKRRLR